MRRLNRIELEDYIENAGLTDRMIYIIKSCYFEREEKAMWQIAEDLHISESQAHRIKKSALLQMLRYDKLKIEKEARK